MRSVEEALAVGPGGGFEAGRDGQLPPGVMLVVDPSRTAKNFLVPDSEILYPFLSSVCS
jgi:hypothetical protein